MRLGVLQDYSFAQRPGGAQKATELYLADAPADLEIVPCPPGSLDHECDAYLTFLVKRYSDEELSFVQSRPYIRCGYDWWPAEDGRVEWRNSLAEQALLNNWVSPLHRDRSLARWHVQDPDAIRDRSVVIAPPLSPDPYMKAREEVVGRSGTLWAAEWHPAKGPDLAAMWALRNRTFVDFYSPSMHPEDRGAKWVFNRYCLPKGFCPEEKWLETFASYERFLHTSRVPDAFGYAILEAYLLGLETVVSGLTGVESYGLPLGSLATLCYSATEDFWAAVEKAL